MAAWSIIKKSELELGSRLDAEYYQLYYLAFDNKMKSISFKYLKEISERISRGKQPEYVEYGNIFAFTSEQIRNDFVARDSARFTNQIFYEKNIKAHAKYNDVLLNSTGRGTLGRVNFYYLKDKAVVDGHITIIRTKEDIINPIFLNVFLKTIYGQYQIERSYTGSSGQIEIYPDQIKEFKIYIPPLSMQDDISDFIKKAINLKLESEKLYSQAEQILLEELGLKNLDLKDDLFYTTTLKKVKDNNRMDTYFFMPKFDIGLSKLKGKYKLKSVLELSRDVTTGQYCNEYIDRKSGIPYIRGTDISNATINEDNLMYVDNLKNNGSKKAKEGDVVTTRVGTIGLVARIPRELEGCIISDNLIRIRLPKKSEISLYYLTMYLNSPFGKDLMISYSRGSVQQRLNQETLKEIPIPIVSNSLQVKIERFLVESWRKRKEAKKLLEQAKHKVEEMIEKEAGVK
jgi:restriction endonuclease S subunit